LAYVGSNDHRLYALRISDGLREWSFTSTGPINNPPVVDAIGRIYFHNQAKDIFCILPSGHEEWRAHMGALSRGVMTIGPDNTLYVGCSDGLDGLAIIRQHALHLAPTGLSIDRGVVLGGGLPALLGSDDDYLRIRPGITLVSSQSPIQFVTTMLSPRPQLASFKLFVESASTSTSVRQQIEAFNFSSNSYEVISTQPTTVSDNVLEVSIIINPNRFVQSGSGLMRFRFSYKATGPVLSFPYTVRVDQIRSSVVPAFVP
jgi:hypothetical protein